MINIWDYSDADVVRITGSDGSIYLGHIEDVTSVEDEDEDVGLKEDSITIADGAKGVVLVQSEIASIEVLRMPLLNFPKWVQSMRELGFPQEAIDRRIAIYVKALETGAVDTKSAVA